MLENLREAGVTEAQIVAEIENPKRNRGEFPSQFAERLLKQHTTRKTGSTGGTKGNFFDKLRADAEAYQRESP